MSVAICSWSSTVAFPLEKKQEALMSVPARDDDVAEEVAAGRPPGELFDIWTSIQARAEAKESKEREPYVHPLAKHSSSLMSQKSLETCTESLGSETGSDSHSSSSSSDDEDEDEDEFSVLFSGHRPMKRVVAQQHERKEQAASVNYHCSVGRRSPSRPFPPPLPSVSCRGGPCVQMRPHRRDGRLVVEAVAVPSQNYLHAERRGGRLLLSFIDSATAPKRNNAEQEEEEEVEVVDRGTVVEVNVSGGGGGGGSGAMKVHRSSIVINKFVSRTPRSSGAHGEEDVVEGLTPASAPLRRSTTSATTAAAAAVAASSLGAFPADDGGGSRCSERKLLLLVTTSERRNREELLSDVKRCSQLRKPLFIWETCRIATSS